MKRRIIYIVSVLFTGILMVSCEKDLDLAPQDQYSEANFFKTEEQFNLFANQFFPEEAIPAIERMCETSEGIVALEAIMSAMKDPSVSEQNNIAANFSEVELQDMMKDERYWNPARRDDNWVNKVNEGYQKLYG